MEDIGLKRALAFLPLAILIALFLASPMQARASDTHLDGGGLPTRTPTRVRNPLPPSPRAVLPSPTLFPASATPTQLAGFVAQEGQPPASNAGVASEQARPFSLMSCWPFALVVILVLIVGVLWLNGRIRQNTV